MHAILRPLPRRPHDIGCCPALRLTMGSRHKPMVSQLQNTNTETTDIDSPAIISKHTETKIIAVGIQREKEAHSRGITRKIIQPMTPRCRRIRTGDVICCCHTCSSDQRTLARVDGPCRVVERAANETETNPKTDSTTKLI